MKQLDTAMKGEANALSFLVLDRLQNLTLIQNTSIADRNRLALDPMSNQISAKARFNSRPISRGQFSGMGNTGGAL